MLEKMGEYWQQYRHQNWTTYDYTASCIWWFTGSLAIPINIILLYLIIAKSPSSLRLYTVFLINVTLGDLVFAVSTTMAQIRIIPNKWAFAYVSLGPAGILGGSQGGYFTYCVMLHSLFYMFLCFPISFGFRYWILIRPLPSITRCIFLCLGLWSVAVIQHILFVLSQSPEKEIRDYLKLNKPEYDLDDFFVSGNHMINSPLTSITLSTIIFPMFPIYCLVIYFYKKVHENLMANASKMSPGTMKGHKKLIEVLTIQASLPILFIFPPITLYGLYHLEFINMTIAEYAVYTIFSFMPAVSPMISIYYIKPYNVAFRKLFCNIPIAPQQTKSVTKYADKGETQYSSSRLE